MMAVRGTAGTRKNAPAGCRLKTTPRYSHPLYDLRDVENALGQRGAPESADDKFHGDPEEAPPVRREDNEYQARVGGILARGEAGRWRVTLGPVPSAVATLEELARRTPHLDEFSSLVRRHLKAATNIGLPMHFPPTLLLGRPGTGKTWYLYKLAHVLGVPFRHYPMNASSLSEGLQGGHPSWRNAQPGLIATTLLNEKVSNPLMLIDEFDKTQEHGHNSDPYRPFYTLLEPINAAKFRDEYLQFPIDASAVMYAMSANDIALVPEPILNRLTIIEVPEIGAGQLAAIVDSIYVEANAARRGFFDAEPGAPIRDAILEIGTPRGIRLAIEAAMVEAASQGRRTILPEDVRAPWRPRRARAGFLS